MEASEDRPPYVQFEIRSVEDRDASIKAGSYVGKDVHYAIVTPAGSRDRHEKQVDLWFATLSQAVGEGRFKAEWLDAYRKGYKMWLEGQEIPVEGTPIKNWAVPTPSQRERLLSLNIRTVEDLAKAPDDVVAQVGMGAVALRQRAIDYFANRPAEQQAAEMEALRVRAQNLEADNQKLAETVKELTAKVNALTAPQKG